MESWDFSYYGVIIWLFVHFTIHICFTFCYFSCFRFFLKRFRSGLSISITSPIVIFVGPSPSLMVLAILVPPGFLLSPIWTLLSSDSVVPPLVSVPPVLPPFPRVVVSGCGPFPTSVRTTAAEGSGWSWRRPAALVHLFSSWSLKKLSLDQVGRKTHQMAFFHFGLVEIHSLEQ